MKLLELFSKQFQAAPHWQKIILIGLLSFLLYYIGVRPSVYFLEKNLQQLDRQRDHVFRDLNTAKYILEDAQLISRNYRTIQEELDKNLYSRGNLQKLLEKTCLENSKKAKVSFPEQPRGYGKLQTLTMQATATASSDQVRALLKQLARFPHSQITLVDYKNQQLVLTAEFLTGTSAPRQVKPQKATPKTNISIPQINGFLTLEKENKVFITGKVYGVGDKYGKYTIIAIYPAQRYISVRSGGKVMTWRSARRGGK